MTLLYKSMIMVQFFLLTIAAQAGNWSMEVKGETLHEEGKVLKNFWSALFQPQANNPKTQGKLRSVLWSAMMKGYTTTLKLPNLGTNVLPTPDPTTQEIFFWEVVALKTSDPSSSEFDLPNESPFNSQTAIQNVKHVSTYRTKF